VLLGEIDMVMYRKDELVIDEYYHICSKSIAGYKIFNTKEEYLRMLFSMRYYQIKGISVAFSDFMKKSSIDSFNEKFFEVSDKKDFLVNITAFCIMPTHIHLIVQQLVEKGISRFMSNILNSYTRYFNLKHKRRGPLWEGRFKSVLVENDEQLLHLTRYIHLNPTSAGIIDKPQEWIFSSYREYIGKCENSLCNIKDVMDISKQDYKRFVEDRILDQRELAQIKHLILEQF